MSNTKQEAILDAVVIVLRVYLSNGNPPYPFLCLSLSIYICIGTVLLKQGSLYAVQSVRPLPMLSQ